MTYLQSLILGIIQGLTEFLPISSSAHLVLTPYLFGWEIPAEQVFPFDVLVQLGTLVAVILYFWNDLWNILRGFVSGILSGHPFTHPSTRLGWYLILATIPAGAAGLFLKDTVEQAFQSPVATALFLFLTAALLVFAERFGRRQKEMDCLTWKDALIIGCFQILSLFPGVSRSGSTIAGGMSRHLERSVAGRFSFLMAVPVMLAAGVFSAFDLADVPNLTGFLPVLMVGFVAAAVVGFLSIHWLLKFLTRRPLTIFAIYCVLFGGLNLIVAYV